MNGGPLHADSATGAGHTQGVRPEAQSATSILHMHTQNEPMKLLACMLFAACIALTLQPENV